MNTDSPNGTSKRGESIVELIRGIFHDVRTLSSQEFAAVKLEIRQEISKALISSISLGIGIFLLAMGLLLLSLALSLVIARYAVLPVWASLGIVGAAYGLIGVVIVLVGKHKMKATKPIPRETLRSVRDDAHYIREKAAGR